jgi:NAD(P)-dependent dehydrogenase (short-subunit alcohol dehydrogenase family)
MVKSYAGEIEQTNVRANVFYPGAVRTAMRAKAMPGEDPDTLPQPREIAGALVDMVSPNLTQNGQIYDVAQKGFVAL